jgi:hypothetical protein
LKNEGKFFVVSTHCDFLKDISGVAATTTKNPFSYAFFGSQRNKGSCMNVREGGRLKIDDK